MASQPPPPPPPPPHGQNPRPPGGLPDGNYDIFIIPPHSAGSGFLYLPSLQPNRNSFLAGVAVTLLAVGLWTIVVPAVQQWIATVSTGGGGVGVFLLAVAIGVAGWAWGKTQGEGNMPPPPSGGAGGPGASSSWRSAGGPSASGFPRAGAGAPPPSGSNGPHPEAPPKPQPNPAGASEWEKAREETKKREEERKRTEELKKRREEAQKARDEAERATKAKAEKEKWEQARAREREQREREARERIAKERLAREKEKEHDRQRASPPKAQSAPSKVRSSPSKAYEKPTAHSAPSEDDYSYRPYDTPKRAPYKSSASSVSGYSEASSAASQTTAQTTPPPSHRRPYSTQDPDKIQIKGVYLFSDSFPTKPVSQLVSNQGPVTDGLILHIKTEGLFIDDDIRGVPQREWDVKAWTLKLVEDGMAKTTFGAGLHIFRATTRDTENKKYTFVLDETEAWKVAIGLQRLRKGSQVRALGMNGMKDGDVRGILSSLGYM